MVCARSDAVIGPSREDGGRISVRLTIAGTPFASMSETTASPGADLADRGFGVEGRVGTEGLGGGVQRLEVARREGAQRVLDAVAKLRQNVLGHVVGVLRDEEHADSLWSGSAGRPG